ncbi:MAG: hypothetical protein R3C53_09075 [Pirellulaceae bacterium]
MAKPLVFLFGDQEIAMDLNKVDRSKLYGFKELEVLDEHDEACELATLADDGRTMIGRGGTGLCWLDADGAWRNKSELKPVDVNGDEIKPVSSSFSKPIKLFDTATPEQLLNCNVRLVYSMAMLAENEHTAELLKELGRGTIFTFPYSYRGGLEADTAFLLNNDQGETMLAVGTETEVAYIGIQSQVAVEEETELVEEEDSMSFDMI